MTRTAKLSSAPGCIGSPTMRAVEHPMCLTCVFRTACAKIAGYRRTQLEEVIGAHRLVQPARKRDHKPGDHRAPTINGKEISESTRAFLKELNSAGYDKKELNDLIKSEGTGAKRSRSYPWLVPVITAVARGCTVGEVRDVIKDNGIKGTLASSRAAQFLKVLIFHDLVALDEATGVYAPKTGETP